jgi:HEXXH motif-containing protein
MSLDTMAEGRSDPAIVEQLKQANRSRQLVLLLAVLDRARARMPTMNPLPCLDEAWSLLATAQQRNEPATDRVVAHPRTGLWAANILRRLRNGDVDSDPPMWADLGYLHQLATAAAIHAGLDFQSRVPVWRGAVMLPTLGLANVQGRREWDYAQVLGERGQVLIRGQAGSVQLPDNLAADGAGWCALRTLRTDGCELWFDDVDPYREFIGPTPWRRLPNPEVSQWGDIFRETWQLLVDHHPAIAAELAAGLTTLVPHPTEDRFTLFSASHNDAFGSVVMSRPPDPTTFAAMLVHEFQHSKLGVLLSLVNLFDPAADSDTPLLYAPWRDDPRPLPGVLHGVFSFLGVTAFYRKHFAVETGPSIRAAQFEFAYLREQTEHAVKSLLDGASMSTLGHRFLTNALDRLQEWGCEPLPENVRAAAHRANVDHHLTWRLRHLRPPATTVTELAEAWLRSRPKPAIAPVISQLTPSPGSVTHARLALVRTRLIEPDHYDAYRADADQAMVEIPGMTLADLALIEGDNDTAAELYQQLIAAEPRSSAAWAGLALATCDEVLLGQPELVFAVHQEIQARAGAVTDPARLGRWLA